MTQANASKEILRAPAPITFLSIALIQHIVLLILESLVFARWESWLKPNAKDISLSLTIPTNLGVFIFASIFEVAYIYDALRSKSTVQIGLACFFNLGLLPFAIFQYSQIKKAADRLSVAYEAGRVPLVNTDMEFWGVSGPMLLTMPYIIGVCSLLLMASGWYVKIFFSWRSYRHVNADLQMRRRRLTYQIYIMLVKLEVFFILCFLVVYNVTVLQGHGTEFICNIIGAIVAVVMSGLSMYWCKTEKKMGMYSVMTIHVVSLSYFTYKLVMMYTDEATHWKYEVSLTILTIFGCLSMILILATTINSAICTLNFGKGLQSYMKKYQSTKGLTHAKRASRYSMNLEYRSVSPRWDLDHD